METEGKRLAEVEADVRVIGANLITLTAQVKESNSIISGELRILSAQFAAAGKVNWPLYIAASLFAMSVGTAALSPIWLRQTNVENNIAHVHKTLEEHRLLSIHPQAAEMLKFIDWRLDLLENE